MLGLKYMDMIAKLGVGNAHPGGFAGTLRLLAHVPFPEGANVLEVGCGTGRTACHLARSGYRVTGVDIHQTMLRKAAERAAKEGVQLDLVEASAEHLPFPDGSFHVVMVESVTVFTDAPMALAEYFRVLRPDGMLLDRELFAVPGMPADLEREIAAFYEIRRLFTAEEWLRMLDEAGFHDCRVWDRKQLAPILWEDVFVYPDEHQMPDPDILGNAAIWETANRYEALMNGNQPFFESGVLIGHKRSGRADITPPERPNQP